MSIIKIKRFKLIIRLSILSVGMLKIGLDHLMMFKLNSLFSFLLNLKGNKKI